MSTSVRDKSTEPTPRGRSKSFIIIQISAKLLDGCDGVLEAEETK